MSLLSILRGSAIARVTLPLGLVFSVPCAAQSITNPGFESGTTGWTCSMEVNSASVYGGSGSNKVAEVDGHNNPNSTADDRILCQTITGFTVGAIYALEFDATRRASVSTPSSVAVTVSLEGVLTETVTRTGGWNMVRERFLFTPTSTSHALRITPNFTVSFGMLFDNFNLTVVSPLPVELMRFDAMPTANDVQLEWATATEHDNAGFVVERSADIEVWEPVAEVEGAGNSQTLTTYSAVDHAPLQGTSYYRLKQIDHDGTEDLSSVRSVHFSGAPKLSVWPNPATERVQIRSEDRDLGVLVFNALGQPVEVDMDRNGNGIDLDIRSLATGTYVIRTTGPKASVTRFTKQ